VIKLVRIVKYDEFRSARCYITLMIVFLVNALRPVTRLAAYISVSLFRFPCGPMSTYLVKLRFMI